MNVIYADIIEPLDKNGRQPSTFDNNVNTPPLLQSGMTSSLFIGAGNYPGNSLNATGIFLTGGTFQGPNPFKNIVSQNFQNNIEQQTFTHVISTETEKSSLISNLADISGHYGSIEGSASLNFANQINITQTSLDVFKYAYISLGNMVFDFSGQELADNVVTLLDPTLDHNKDPKSYLSNIEIFLSTYGHYYISSYQLYAEILASWQIDTMSRKDKLDISSAISVKVSGGTADFAAVNKFVSETSSSFSQSSTTFHSIGIGINKNLQTIEQLNDVFNNLLASTEQKTAKISKIFISPWASLSQIANYISKINDLQLQRQVSELLNGPNLTQEIWNRMLILQNSIFSLRSRMQKTIDDPYTYDFWGFLKAYESLPIDKIRNMVSQLNTILDKLNSLDEKDYAASFFEFQRTQIPIWENIQKEYITITKIPTYSFNVETGYFSGDFSGPFAGYELIQGTRETQNFDPSITQVNTAIYTGPILYRPYFFASAWQQGVVTFVLTPQIDKTKNPFSITIECRLAWTGHTDWDAKIETVFFMPNQTKVSSAVVYDTTLVSAPLRGLISIALTENT